MAAMEELARYGVIISYIANLRPGSSILDIGCGEGLLFERFRPYGYTSYVGIDISETAIAKLREKQDDRTRFFAADAETFVPAEGYDVIVFNESLYYFHNPLKTFERYTGAVNENGIIVVSTYRFSTRAMAILRRLKAGYPLLDESSSSHELSAGRSWICSVFLPESRND